MLCLCFVAMQVENHSFAFCPTVETRSSVGVRLCRCLVCDASAVVACHMVVPLRVECFRCRGVDEEVDEGLFGVEDNPGTVARAIPPIASELADCQ